MTAKASTLLVLLALGCSSKETFEVPQWGLQRMLEQPRYDAFEASPFFTDGRTMQAPPDGTVPTDAAPDDEALRSGTRDGVYVQTVVLPLTRSLLARGRDRFDIFCAACHGVLGDSDSIVSRNMPLVRPRSLLTDEVLAYPAGQIYRVITLGFGMMPSYTVQLPIEDRWAVTAYVQALQLSQRARVAELPPDLRRELDRSAR